MPSNISMEFDNSLDDFSTFLRSWIETKTDVETLKIPEKGVD